MPATRTVGRPARFTGGVLARIHAVHAALQRLSVALSRPKKCAASRDRHLSQVEQALQRMRQFEIDAAAGLPHSKNQTPP